MIYCDSHIHIARCKSFPVFSGGGYFCVSSCHSKEDFLAAFPEYYASFGVHPQAVLGHRYSEADFLLLESLMKEKKIVAAGEIGLDFFTPCLKAKAGEQTEIFERQLNLAVEYSLPVVLHLRKSVEKVFCYAKPLSRLPSVVFHSFPGTAAEAKSILRHGVNGFFSFGKPLLNGRKASAGCVEELPLERLLLETDAPYQTLKGEDFTSPDDIKKVYSEAARLRSLDKENLSAQIFENFKKAYLVLEARQPHCSR